MADFKIPAVAPSEADIQALVVDWLALQARAGRLAYYSIPNEAKRSWRLASKLKRMGLQSGVPDLCILGPGFCGYIELKAAKGKLSDNQVVWAGILEKFNIPYALCRSLEEVQGTVNGWLGHGKKK